MQKRIFIILLMFLVGILTVSSAAAEGNTTSIDDLSALIENTSEGDTLELNGDYICQDTIQIKKPMTVDGKGHRLVGGQSRVFDVGANVTLRNIDFVNCSYAMHWRGDNGVLKNCSFVNCLMEGALEWQGKSGLIINCSFINCSAPYSGGALRWFGSDGFITSSNFSNCSTTQENPMFPNGGGAIYWNGENGMISNCIFTSCSSYHGGAVKGGSIYNSTFTNCSAFSGGSVSANNICNCTFTNCSADFGGAISYNGRKAQASTCRFMNCSSWYSGGAIMWNVDYGQIADCSFNNCRSINGGGAVYWDVEYSPVLSTHDGAILNCTFVNCSSEANGNAIEWYGRNATAYDSSFVNCSLKGSAIHGGRAFNCTLNGRDMKLKLNVCDSDFTYDLDTLFINVTDCEGITVEDVMVTIRVYKGSLLLNTYRLPANRDWTVDADVGSYTAVMSVEDSQYGAAENASIRFNVLPAESSLALVSINATVNQRITLTANAISHGRPADGGNVRFYIDDEFIGNASPVNGFANLTYVFNETGEHSLSAFYESNNYLSSNATSKVRVNKAESRILFDDIADVRYNSPTLINVRVLSNGTEIHEGVIMFYVNGMEIASRNVTESNTLTYLSPKAGTLDVLVVFGQSDNYASSNASQTFKVAKSPTSIAASLVDGGRHLEIKLVDGSRKPLSNVKLTVRFSNGKLSTITVKNGKAKVSTGGIVPAKKCTASIAFKGNANYAKSSKKITFTLKKQTPKLTAKSKTFKRSTKTKKYTITLKNSKNKAMKNAKVSIKIAKRTYSAKTNGKGKATFKITKLTKKGRYTATVTYKGSKFYNKLAKKVKITVR